MKSKLDRIEEILEEYEDKIGELEWEVEELKREVSRLEDEEPEIDYPLDISTLDKQMMLERLVENWDNLTLKDIDAICRI